MGDHNLKIKLMDSYGDGWNGTVMVIDTDTDPENGTVGSSLTLDSSDSSDKEIDYNLPTGSYHIYVKTVGDYPDEVSFQLFANAIWSPKYTIDNNPYKDVNTILVDTGAVVPPFMDPIHNLKIKLTGLPGVSDYGWDDVIRVFDFNNGSGNDMDDYTHQTGSILTEDSKTYIIYNLPTGNYNIDFVPDGYYPEEVSFQLFANDNASPVYNINNNPYSNAYNSKLEINDNLTIVGVFLDVLTYNLKIKLMNSYGDGWGGAVMVVDADTDPENENGIVDSSLTLESGSQTQILYNLPNGSYNIYFLNTGENPKEVSFQLFANDNWSPEYTITTNPYKDVNALSVDNGAVVSSFMVPIHNLKIKLMDSDGDGWNGAIMVIDTDTDSTVNNHEITFDDGDEKEIYYNLPTGSYNIYFSDGGYFPGEISFQLFANNSVSPEYNITNNPYKDGNAQLVVDGELVVSSFMDPMSPPPATLSYYWDLRNLNTTGQPTTVVDSIGNVGGTLEKSDFGDLPVCTETGIVFETSADETEGGYIELGTGTNNTNIVIDGPTTIEAVVVFNGFNYYQRYFACEQTVNGAKEGIIIYTEDRSNELNLVIWKDGSYQSHTAYNIPLNKRLHIVASIGDNGSNRLYINGVEVADGDEYIPNSMNNPKCSIGSNPQGTSDSHEYFKGEVSFLKIYNGAMTQEEVTMAYQQTTITESISAKLGNIDIDNTIKSTIETYAGDIATASDRAAINSKLKTITENLNDIADGGNKTKIVHAMLKLALNNSKSDTSNDNPLNLKISLLRDSMGYDQWPSTGDVYLKDVNGFYNLTSNTQLYIPLDEIGDYVKYWFRYNGKIYHYMVKKISEDENHISTYQTSTFNEAYTDESSVPPVPSDDSYGHPGYQHYDGGKLNIEDSLFILYGGSGSGGSGSGGSGSGGSGDPYIHPLIGPVYKLPDAPGNCRFISTKEDLNNRFLVDMSIEKLTFDEQKDLLKQHLQYNRTVLEKRKITIDGYYFRNFYISNKNNYLIVNLEDRTLKAADGEITLDHLYKKGGVATYKNFEINIIKSSKETYKKIANYDKTLVIYTVKVKTYNEVYGNVEIELFSLVNKQIRNSIQIYTENPITVDNSVGAYLMPQHTNNIYIDEIGSNKLLEDVKPYNEKDYNVINEQHFSKSEVINKKLLIQK